jgi:hypothetical protein
MRRTAFILGFAAVVTVHADAGSSPTDIRRELSNLIQSDIRARAKAEKAAPTPPAAAVAQAEAKGDAVRMDPYYVRGPQLTTPKLPPDETWAYRVLRTGVLYHSRGRKITATADVESASAPGNFGKVALAVHLNW